MPTQRMLLGNTTFGAQVAEKSFLMDVGTAHRLKSLCYDSIHAHSTNLRSIQGGKMSFPTAC
jgi:hypothetical protein